MSGPNEKPSSYPTEDSRGQRAQSSAGDTQDNKEASSHQDAGHRHQSHCDDLKQRHGEAFSGNDSVADSGLERASEQRTGEPREPKLEIIRQSESFRPEGDDFVFNRTVIILKKGKDLFAASVKERTMNPKDIDISSLDLTPIPQEHYCPKTKPGVTLAPEPLPDVYIKRAELIGWDPDDEHPEHIADLVLQEAEVHESLMKHPHPNIVRYFGCLVEDGRITGLCLAKCSPGLREKLAGSSLAERERYYGGIERGVKHLHQLGLVHNDLNPSNIMMDGEVPVIIDFDSCRPEGKKFGMKRGTFGWNLEGAEMSTKENDLYGLEKLKAFIMKGGDGGFGP
ncbi:hypothetical protein ACJZ2D_015181 [Fusarium nematophilum]